jgi:MFS family permease
MPEYQQMLEMTLETHITDVARVIQLAIAPVFLLTAVGTIVGVLSTRLARIVDRTRALEDRLGQIAPDDLTIAYEELGVLGRRMRLVYLAIGLSVVCALFVGLLIAIAFVGAFLSVDLSRFVGLLFIAAMLAFIGSLVVFLREIFLAVTSTRNFVHLKEAIRADSGSPSPAGHRSNTKSRVPSSGDLGT